MSDFITMSCPNCGGKLKFSPNELTLVCQYCGMEHLIRHEANSIVLEAFARCPKCKRNDRAEKVTAIIRENAQLANIFIPPKEPVKPSQPYHPEPETTPSETPKSNVRFNENLRSIGKLLLGLIILNIILFWFASFFPEVSISICNNLIIFSNLPLVILGYLLLRYLNSVYEQVEKDSQKQIEKENAQLLEYERNFPDLLLQYENEIKTWNYAKSRWNKMYYCNRDDCLFIPGQKGIGAPETYWEFLYQETN